MMHPVASLGVNAAANETELTATIPDGPESVLRQLLESRITCQPAEQGELNYQTPGSSATGLGDLRSTLLLYVALALFWIEVEGRFGVEWNSRPQVYSRIWNASRSPEGRQQSFSEVVGQPQQLAIVMQAVPPG
ncbi:MAG: hypothetical protein M1823_007499, partial [Watsoniomyces obsoletus]